MVPLSKTFAGVSMPGILTWAQSFEFLPMHLFPWLLMLCAAFAAGAINSIAGGGTLLTFPVLIWLGLDPKVANATSTVALWPGLLGGVWGYRKEVKKVQSLLLPFGLTSLVGGAV